MAVEPDERCGELLRRFRRAPSSIHARIEDAALLTNGFDIVHSCHTIEHLADPASVLADHWRVLKRDGLLVIDAPNIAFLGINDIVEEWFIDKHLYHFSPRTLSRMIEMAGFKIVEGPDRSDRENLLIRCTQNSGGPTSFWA